MNPILDMLSKTSPQMNGITNVINTIKTAVNPQAMINQMMADNPQVQETRKIVDQYGGDPRKAFYEIAKQRGVDPNEILRQLNM